MGANEKHEAAMNGFTPATDEVRALYVAGTPVHRVSVATSYAEFDRWLDQIRAEAKAEALNEAADQVSSIDGREDYAARDWLRARANQIKEGQ